MKKWIACSDLCSRWNISKYDLADIVFNGRLQAFFGEDFSALYIVAGGSFVEYPDGQTSALRKEPLTIEEVIKLIFRISDVEEYEKKNSVSPHLIIEKDGKKEERTTSEKDPESFICSLQVSYVSDTEIKIKCGNQRAKIFTQKELGFRKANSEIWKTFIQILTRPDHTYSVGKAHGAYKGRRESYDVAQKRLSGINNKLLSFFNKNHQAQLPSKFRAYELIPEKKEAPGTYRFKFQIVDASQVVKENYDNLSKQELIHEIENLSSELRNLSNRGDEDSEEKINEIQNRLYLAMKIATDKEWLTRHRAEGYLKPSEEYISQTDQSVKRKKHPDLVDTFSKGEGSEE